MRDVFSAQVQLCFINDAATLYKGLPQYESEAAAGLDLRAVFAEEDKTLAPGERLSIGTGVSINPQNTGIAAFVFSRSGLGAQKGLTVAQGVGVIDSDYRGEITVFLLNTSQENQTISRGERIAQLVFMPIARVQLQEVKKLASSKRGTGGFGHTGNM